MTGGAASTPQRSWGAEGARQGRGGHCFTSKWVDIPSVVAGFAAKSVDTSSLVAGLGGHAPGRLPMLPVEERGSMRIWSITAVLIVVASTKTAGCPPPNNPSPSETSLTGTWQSSIDAGNPATDRLRYVLLDDAGMLTGVELVNDPLVTAQFHTVDVLSGMHAGSVMTLHAAVTGDTITATFDGGTLVGIDRFSQPLVFQDGVSAYQLNISFVMTRISTDATIADGGFQ